MSSEFRTDEGEGITCQQVAGFEGKEKNTEGHVLG